MNELSKELMEGKRIAISKALTIIENDLESSKKLIKSIIDKVGRAKTIGITGPAGAGKSTLISKIVDVYKNKGIKIAVLAIDPTSSITGGALLGDRVRMQQHTLDDRVYIRSMASRGALGGISRAVPNAIRILDVAGFERIIIESVGAGQLDAGIAKIADITIVVFNPQTGDSIQAIKAGLTEIGDIYVVNKADLEGADRLFYDIKELITNRSITSNIQGIPRGIDGNIPLIKTIALEGKGVEELVNLIEKVLESKRVYYNELERKKVELELLDIVEDIIRERLKEVLKDKYKKYIDMVIAKMIDPYTAAEEIANSILVRT